jgi:hypothetical protein
MRAALLTAVVTLAASAAACSAASRGRGEITGAVPLCYGPGPHDNLTPEVTVFVRQHGQLVAQGRFESNDTHPHRYSFSLRPGTYSLTSSSDRRAITVQVRSGEKTHKDLPEPGCV